MLAVLLLLAGNLLAHLTLVMARHQLAASVAAQEVLAVTLGARQGVRDLLHTGQFSDSTAIGAEGDRLGGQLGAVRYTGHSQRLSAEVWLLTGEGQGPRSSLTRSLPVWTLDPETRSGRFTGGVAEGAGAISTVFGPLTLDEAIDAVPEVADSIGTPSPSEGAGVCLPDPWNWGDPAGGVCGEEFQARGRNGDLFLENGTGQGLLLVTGSVTLRATDFHGLIVATGAVALVDGSSVTGGIVTDSTLSLSLDAELAPSSHMIEAALRNLPFKGPIPIRESVLMRH